MDYPLINGLRLDYSCVEVNANGKTFTGVTEVNYTQKLEPGKVRGTSAQVNGRTRGQYDPDASITMLKEDAQELIAALGAGYMERPFDIVVHYSAAAGATLTDRIVGCRIKESGNAHKEGGDALSVKFALDVIAIIENGVAPVTGLRV
jgi:hypothetical protein